MKAVNRTIGIALALAFCLNSALANNPSAPTGSEPEAQVVAAADAPPGESAPEAAAEPTPESSGEAVAAPVATSPAESTPEAAASAGTATATPRFGPGMQIPVDGTSLEAFEQSLAGIKDKTTTREYTTLNNAIDYLMVYYLEALRDRTKLAALLNGLTGEQIVDKVTWRKRSDS